MAVIRAVVSVCVLVRDDGRESPLEVVAASRDAEVAVLDRDGVIVAVNAAWAESVQRCGAGDLAGCGAGTSYLAACGAAQNETSTVVGRAVRQALAGDLPAPARIRVACDAGSCDRRDGARSLVLLVSSRFGDTGACVGATVVLVPAAGPGPGPGSGPGGLPDVTERVTEKLAASQAAILDSVPDPVVVTDPATMRVRYANQAACELLGYTEPELIGMPARQLRPELSDEARRPQVAELVAQPDVARVLTEVQLRTKDGRLIECESHVRAVPDDAHGQLLIYVVRDVRERLALTERLRASEASFRTVFEQAPAALIAHVDSQGRRRIVRVNQALAHLLGAPIETLLGGDLSTLIVPEDEPDAVADLRAVATGQRAQASMLLRFRRRDGSSLWTEVRVVPVELPDLDGPLVLVHMVDVTARQEALERLKASEAAFRTMFEQTPVGTELVRVRLDGSREIVLANQALADMFREPVQALVGASLAELTLPEDEPTDAATAAQFATGQVTTAARIKQYRRRDGSRLWTEARGTRIDLPSMADGSGQLVLAHLVDVTDRVQATERSFRTVLEKAPIAAAVIEAGDEGRQRIVLANSALGVLLGEPVGELPGQDLADYVLPEQEPAGRARGEQLAGAGVDATSGVTRFRCRDGRIVWVDVRATGISLPGLGASDRPTLLAFLSDVTARHQADQERQRALATLQAALLPHDTVTTPGVRIAARYRAAGTDDQIGGDWYDTVALPGGGLGLVIGDVEGHDLTAASVMGLVRGAVRSYALEGHPPARVLEQVNAFLLSAGAERLVTLAYVQLYADDRAVTAASAGHPLPWIVPRDGTTASPLDLPAGPPLGVLPTAQWQERTVVLPPEADLVLYTDGLVEFPTAAEDQVEVTMARARDRNTAGASVDDLADSLLSTASSYDDIAILIARPSAADEPHLERTLPAQPISAWIARIWITDLWTHWRASGALQPDDADVLQETSGQLITELVANAVRYSDHAIRLHVSRTPDRLRVEVADSSERMPVLQLAADTATQGRGLLLVETLSSSWGVTLTDHGKTVWFELDLSSPCRTSAATCP